ncbi:hypothetical protein IJ670_06385 [bacterium]|nr:hypothetical protein [bacterium]
MLVILHFVHILIYLLAIIFSCNLFTNAIEHLGANLKLNQNATGSILAVIGTTLPETVVPIVAILSAIFLNCNIKSHEQIAQGAILGSPFMLSCLGLFLLGIVLTVKKRKNLDLNFNMVLRDYKYFLICYCFAIFAFFAPTREIKSFIALFLGILYVIFVYRTLIKCKNCTQQENLDPLIFSKMFAKFNINNTFLIYLQIIISITCLIVFAHLFLHEIVWFSDVFKISPFILSLIVTPFCNRITGMC